MTGGTRSMKNTSNNFSTHLNQAGDLVYKFSNFKQNKKQIEFKNILINQNESRRYKNIQMSKSSKSLEKFDKFVYRPASRQDPRKP